MAEMTPCPFCKGEIDADALKCRHCGEWVKESPARPVAQNVKAAPAGARYCSVCGTVAKPKRVTQGSVLIEIVLWLAFLVPGLIYSIWRLTSRYDGCPACGARNMMPLTAPAARAGVAPLPDPDPGPGI